MKVKVSTLVMIMDETNKRVLLGMKKRGFGQGWWNGFGGKLQQNETTEECAVRETKEECGPFVVLRERGLVLEGRIEPTLRFWSLPRNQQRALEGGSMNFGATCGDGISPNARRRCQQWP